MSSLCLCLFNWSSSYWWRERQHFTESGYYLLSALCTRLCAHLLIFIIYLLWFLERRYCCVACATWNAWSSCLSLSSAGIADLCHHIWIPCFYLYMSNLLLEKWRNRLTCALSCNCWWWNWYPHPAVQSWSAVNHHPTHSPSRDSYLLEDLGVAGCGHRSWKLSSVSRHSFLSILWSNFLSPSYSESIFTLQW